MDELTSEPEDVRSRQDLSAFILSLLSDYEKDSESWENNSLPRYLEALAAWTTDMDGYFKNIGEEVPEPSWSLMATMLEAAKYYE